MSTPSSRSNDYHAGVGNCWLGEAWLQPGAGVKLIFPAEKFPIIAPMGGRQPGKATLLPGWAGLV